MRTDFQSIILNLQRYWAEQGCVILQPYDMEVGAGTFHPATTLRSLGPDEVWNVAYVQPSRRPTDGRYGENPNRLQHYYQFQTIMKHMSARGAALNGLETSDWFQSRKALVEKALLCTLAEAGVAIAWQKPSVQLAVLLTFQCKTPPLPTLDDILGAVIRSVSRRVDDLHYECLRETPDPASLCRAFEVVAESILR